MSAIVYGRMVRRAETGAADFRTLSEDAKKENKLISGVAALVPAEILVLHVLVLERTTMTENGTTTVTDETWLKRSLPVLAVLAVLVFLIGRGFGEWQGRDWILMILPAAAFVAWTGLIGTSALTPWLKDISQGGLVLIAGVIAVLLIAIHARLNPPAGG